MKKTLSESPAELLKTFANLEEKGIAFTGIKTDDLNFPGNFLLIVDSNTIYSFTNTDVLSEEKLEGGKTKVVLNSLTIGMRIIPYAACKAESTLISAIEKRPQPLVIKRSGDAKKATTNDIETYRRESPADRTLKSVASKYNGNCSRDPTEKECNDCAHYLSDAFILAGYNELLRGGGSVEIKEWCTWDMKKNYPKGECADPTRFGVLDKGNNSSMGRPIRAKEMWAWFQSRPNTKVERKRPSKKGLWAVFQWDPSYPGGHVLLYDSDKNIYMGTGDYPEWKDQFYYQW